MSKMKKNEMKIIYIYIVGMRDGVLFSLFPCHILSGFLSLNCLKLNFIVHDCVTRVCILCHVYDMLMGRLMKTV